MNVQINQMTRAHILILEDDPVLGAMLEESLRQEGYSTFLAEDATAAIAAFKAQSFDLLVADIIIKKDGRPVPEGGIILTWRIKQLAQSRGRAIPVIAMSGSLHSPGMEDVLEYASSVGADDILAKPFSPQRLLKKIQRLLATAYA